MTSKSKSHKPPKDEDQKAFTEVFEAALEASEVAMVQMEKDLREAIDLIRKKKKEAKERMQ